MYYCNFISLTHTVGCCQEHESYCLSTYNAIGCRTCFRVFSDESDERDFDGSHLFCQAQGANGRLLIFDNVNQLSLISTYLKLNNVNETFWTGMRYINKNGNIELVDINGNVVALNVAFEEGTPQAAVGLCVAIVSRGDDQASFLREKCDNRRAYICTITSIG